MTTVLITGAGGFTARHLVGCLAGKDSRLFLSDLRAGPDPPGLIACNLASLPEVDHLLAKVMPDQVYHLAGSFSNDYPADYEANVLSSKNLLDGVVKLGRACRVLLIGSAAEYGDLSATGSGIAEDAPLEPVSVYGLTKVMQTQLMKYYVNRYDANVVMARPFNLLGKGMSNKLFVGRVYEQIDRFRKQEAAKIVVGSLSASRDYVPVEQAVDSYRLIMASGERGHVYNVASGRPIRISDLLHDILEAEGLDMSVVDAQEYSSSSVRLSYADTSKLDRLRSRETER